MLLQRLSLSHRTVFLQGSAVGHVLCGQQL
jgi:hypothetical protein